MNEEQQHRLVEGLRALSETSRNAAASRRVQEAVLAEAQRIRAERWDARRAGSGRWLPLAAALVLSVAGALWSARATVPVSRGVVIHPSGFVTLPSAYGLP